MRPLVDRLGRAASVLPKKGAVRVPIRCRSQAEISRIANRPQLVVSLGVLVLLDRFLPEFDVRTQHVIRVDAPPGRVYASLWSTDFDHWGITRALYALRTLPALALAPANTWHCFREELRLHQLTLQDLLDHGFGLLAEQAGEELVIGTVGRFWRARGELWATTGADFVKPASTGTAKAAWNFAVH